uniref:Uncharacterized protein n=1 Tax=Nomascus leucogenys TaxID=61853 RepID=A0A2I3H9I3_NOMLE
MAAFAMELQAPALGSEPMMLASSPKPGVNPQSISGPLIGVMEMRSPLLAGGSPPQPVVLAQKDKSGAPQVRSIYDDISSLGLGSTPLTSRRQVLLLELHRLLEQGKPLLPTYYYNLHSMGIS